MFRITCCRRIGTIPLPVTGTGTPGKSRKCPGTREGLFPVAVPFGKKRKRSESGVAMVVKTSASRGTRNEKVQKEKNVHDRGKASFNLCPSGRWGSEWVKGVHPHRKDS